MALKHIKLKIQSVKKTSTVTRAMEAVSAVKMRKAQERALSTRAYARAALRILSSISGSSNLHHHPLTQEREDGKVALLVITSDKGLAGALNSAVLKKLTTFISEERLAREDVLFLCLGKRGYEFAANRDYEVIYHQTNISDDIDENSLREVTKTLLGLYEAGTVREVRVAYTDFKSTFEQSAEMHKILPLSQAIIESIVAEIKPTKGKYTDVPEMSERQSSAGYTMEPSEEIVLNELMPRLVNIAIYHKMLESKASEHSARMVAMKSATDKAKEMAKMLTRKFNKVRQAAITREVSEITSGIEAMR